MVDDPLKLKGFRLLLFETDLGRLDVLGELPPLEDVRTLPSVERKFGDGLLFQVLSLDALIEVKAHVGRPKDRAMEAELRAIRNVLARGSKS